MKIALRLILMFVILALIAISLGGVSYYVTAKQALEERIEAQLESVVILKENQLNGFIEEEREDLESIAKEKIFRDRFIEMLEAHSTHDPNEPLHHEAIKGLLKEKLGTMGGDFIELFILGMSGEVHISTDEIQEGKIKSNEHYFIEGKKGTFVQNFYYDLSLQEPAMTISTPLKDSEGNLLGVLAARINLEKIDKIMAERSGLGETGETYLVNKFNYMVTESRFDEGLTLKKTVHTEGTEKCLKGNSGHAHYDDYRNVPVIGRYKWIPEREVCLLAEINREEGFAPIEKLRNTIFVLNIIFIVLIAIVGFFFSRNLVKDITKLKNAADKISKGDLTKPIKIKSKDEIGELAESFDDMRYSLKMVIDEYEKVRGGGKLLEKLKKEIEERKKIEEALKESEERFKDLLENANDLIQSVDANGKFAYVNKKWKDVLGYSDKEIKKFTFKSILRKDQIPHCVNIFKKLCKKHSFENVETVFVSKKGKEIFVSGNINAQFKDGKFVATMGIFRDITRYKKAEEKLKK